jgi:hypothetical protein
MNFLILGLALFFVGPGVAQARTLVWGCTDCYSTASMLPAAALEAAAEIKAQTGEEITIQWVHIKTHKYSAAFEAHLNAFPENTVRLEVDPEDDASVDRLIAKLRELGVERIVNSTTCEGNYQGCRFSHLLGTPDDSFDTRDLRKKKRLQGEVANEYGISSHVLTNAQAATDFVRSATDEVVMKFDGGGASFGLKYLLPSDPNVEDFFARTLDNRPLGQFGQNDDILLQYKVIGPEYHAQTFTHEGVTYLTALWKYYKVRVGTATIYFVDRPVSLFSREARELRPILQELCVRFGKRNGASHFEFMKERSGWWRLIEDNARLVGGAISALEKKIWGISQVELLIWSLLDPERLLSELNLFPRKMRGDAALFVIPSPGVGTLNPASLELIERLPTFLEPPLQFRVSPGKVVGDTEDLQSAAMVARFFGPTGLVRSNFYRAYRELISGNLIQPTGDCAQYVARAEILFPLLEKRRSQIRWNFRP